MLAAVALMKSPKDAVWPYRRPVVAKTELERRFDANLVIGQGLHADAESELICLNAQTGALHWLVKTPLHIEGSPAIEGDVAVVGAGAIEENEDDQVRGHPGLVLAVRISDGKKLWEYQVNDPETPPAIAGGVVYPPVA